MASTLFAAPPPEYPCELIDITLTDAQAFITLATVVPSACCPKCQVASRRVHSRYGRTLGDVPVGSRSVCLHLRVRKFFCDNPDCSQTTPAPPSGACFR